jgi:signal transduction histidine kinase
MNGLEAMSSVAEPQRSLRIISKHHGETGVLVRVQDCGVGLAMENRDRIFETFFTTKQHGMGMGLAISRSIIDAHGGRLWAEPSQGPGASFEFTLAAA